MLVINEAGPIVSVAVVDACGGLRVVVAGEVDSANVETLIESFRLIDTKHPSRVVVDLGATTFFGVCGINALVDAQIRVADGGGMLRVEGASPFVRRCFDVLGVGVLLNTTPRF